MTRPLVSRNDPCPCGSGRKFKKCCYQRDRSITSFDRSMVIDVLERYIERCEERFAASRVFYGDLDLDVPTMTDHFREVSNSAFCFWFIFDYQLDDGSNVVDGVLKANPVLSAGELRYLEQLRGTAMMPYDVVDVQPGVSIVLRRLNDGSEIEVREKTASGTLKRWDMLLTRVNPLGPSGGAEMEAGVMHVPPLAHDEVADIVRCELEHRSGGDDDVRRFKKLGPVFHQIWLSTIVAPRFPKLVTAEGDPVMFVTMRFDALDADRVRSALNAAPDLQGKGDSWSWLAHESILGTIRLDGSQLTLETHSDPRADRGRQLIERIAQDAVAYRSCDRVDVAEEAREAVRSGRQLEAPPNAADEIPAEIRDQLHQAYMAKFSQQWLDDHVPALDRQTPRVAAGSATLRPRLVGLLKDMENDYLRIGRWQACVRSHLDVGRTGTIRRPGCAASTASALAGPRVPGTASAGHHAGCSIRDRAGVCGGNGPNVRGRDPGRVAVRHAGAAVAERRCGMPATGRAAHAPRVLLQLRNAAAQDVLGRRVVGVDAGPHPGGCRRPPLSPAIPQLRTGLHGSAHVGSCGTRTGQRPGLPAAWPDARRPVCLRRRVRAGRLACQGGPDLRCLRGTTAASDELGVADRSAGDPRRGRR